MIFSRMDDADRTVNYLLTTDLQSDYKSTAMWVIQIQVTNNGGLSFLWLVGHATMLDLQSDWYTEIPEQVAWTKNRYCILT